MAELVDLNGTPITVGHMAVTHGKGRLRYGQVDKVGRKLVTVRLLGPGQMRPYDKSAEPKAVVLVKWGPSQLTAILWRVNKAAEYQGAWVWALRQVADLVVEDAGLHERRLEGS